MRLNLQTAIGFLFITSLAHATPQLVNLIQDERFIHGVGTVTDAAGESVADFDVVIPDTPFDLFLDSTSIDLDTPDAFFQAYADQQSQMIGNEFVASGSTNLELGATQAPASAAGNTCTHFIVMFEVAQPTAYALTGMVDASDENVDSPESWTEVSLDPLDSELLFDERIDGPGLMLLAMQGVLEAGFHRLTVESHASGSVQAVATGVVGSSYEIQMVFSEPATGDLNGDGTVNATDLALLLGSWGPCKNCLADLNGDGAVNPVDLAMLLGNWG